MGGSTSGRADAILLSFVSVQDVSRVVGWGSIIMVSSKSVGESGAGWPIFYIVGRHEIISFRKWKINPQTDRVNKYATLMPNQVWIN